MKKILCLLLVLCVLFCVGCTNPQQGGDEPSETPQDSGSGNADPPGSPNEWHLSGEPEEEPYISYSDYGVEIPEIKYDETINDIRFELDFFEGYYPAGSILQYQLTVTNNTGADLRYEGHRAVAHLCPEEGTGDADPVPCKLINPYKTYNTRYDPTFEESPLYTLLAGKSEVFQGYLRVDERLFRAGAYLFRVVLTEPREISYHTHAVFSCPVNVVYEEFEVIEEELPTWHISEWKKPDEAKRQPYISYDDYGLEIPEPKVDETVNGFRFELDFFDDFYSAGSLLQYRLRITNNTGEAVSIREPAAVGAVMRGGAEYSFNMVTPKGLTYDRDSNAPPRTFQAGETLVYEGYMRVGADFFNELTYHFRVFLIDSDANAQELARFSCQINSVYRGKDSEEETPPAESSSESIGGNEGETLFDSYLCDPTVGHYETMRDGILVGVDFWNVPEPWDGNGLNPWQGKRLEGTLTYTNNTGARFLAYLHAFNDMGYWMSDKYMDGGLFPYSPVPIVEQNEQLETITVEEPLLLDLAHGETITVNFSIEVPLFGPVEAIYYMGFGFYANEAADGRVFCPINFRIHR